VASVVESGDAAPTTQDYATFADLSKQLDAELASLNEALATDLPEFNAMLEKQHIAPVEKRALPAVEQGTSARSDDAEDEDAGEK